MSGKKGLLDTTGIENSQLYNNHIDDDKFFHVEKGEKNDSDTPLFEHRPCIEDIHQSDCENTCYILSVLGTIVNNNPDQIINMIKDEGNTCIVKLFGIGDDRKKFIPRYIRVPKRSSIRASTNSAEWVNIILNAYIKGGFTNENYCIFFKDHPENIEKFEDEYVEHTKKSGK